MEILGSLQSGGSFYYAPDLPFIEKHLGTFTYQRQNYSMDGYEFRSSHIQKI